MKSIVLYDSNFGNTQKVAETIAEGLSSSAVKISTIEATELRDYDLIILGTPIIAWKPTVRMQAFLGKLSNLKGVKATTFDTRVKLLIHGDAMGKVADALVSVGAKIIIDPAPFYVAGPQQNPHLLDGEIEKAKKWAEEINRKSREK